MELLYWAVPRVITFSSQYRWPVIHLTLMADLVPFVLLPASTKSVQSHHHAVVIIKATRSSERTNLPAFLTLFNIAISVALFNYGKLHTMVEFCRLLQMVYSN
jgi:hypothetical protein